MPVITLDDGQAESLRGILAEVLDRDITYAELQPVYETLVAWEFEERAECNDCGREYPVTEMIDIGRQGTGYECELCNERGVEN